MEEPVIQNLEQQLRDVGVPHSKLPGAVQLAAPFAVQWAKVYKNLLDGGRLAQAASLVSASQRGTGRWLTSHGGWDARIKVRADEYRAALGLRLLIDPIPVPGDSCCRCHPTDGDVYFWNHPLHPLCCFHHQQIRNRRHDLVRDLLFDLIKRMAPNNPDVQKERSVGEGTVCDIWYRVDNRVYVIDVAVAEPSASAYMQAGAAFHEARAAIEMEKIKRLRYRNCPALAEGNGGVLVPFVMEATGRFGAEALAFLDIITLNQKLYQSIFLDQVAGALARARGQMVISSRKFIVD